MANDLLQERIEHSGIYESACPTRYRGVMLHRKLMSEEVTVLDLRINHTGDKEEKGGWLCHTARLHSRCTDFWRTHQRMNKKRWEP